MNAMGMELASARVGDAGILNLLGWFHGHSESDHELTNMLLKSRPAIKMSVEQENFANFALSS